MLHCFGGAVLSGLMLAQPSVAPLSNTGSVLLASLVWYLVFYCPLDLVYRCAAFLPIRLVLSSMKEVSRTWKVLGGVTQARSQYKDGLLVMVAVGWARGAGSGLIGNFEQLVRGVWKPETNELLKMSYPTKVTLMGAVLFTLQQAGRLPIEEHHLVFVYTVFLVYSKVWMMLTGSASSPLAPLEAAMYRVFFALQPQEPTCTMQTCDQLSEPGNPTRSTSENSSTAGSVGLGSKVNSSDCVETQEHCLAKTEEILAQSTEHRTHLQKRK
ncbi:trimeric intracellular cation channel type B-like isoform X2 [Scleropages formosus]|nr:trimeric intracellular cation channel type B-like isoform X2 [Scleropages formosus]XP_018601955.1 trimeric intracellular cation channel type B-like isoform X2 [Scleropages formosus]